MWFNRFLLILLMGAAGGVLGFGVRTLVSYYRAGDAQSRGSQGVTKAIRAEGQKPPPREVQNTETTSAKAEGVVLTGILQKGSRWVFSFSDGATLTDQDLATAGVRWVCTGKALWIEGKRVALMPAPVREKEGSGAVVGGAVAAVPQVPSTPIPEDDPIWRFSNRSGVFYQIARDGVAQSFK